MSFKTLYFSARNAPECRKMHLNSQISRGSMPLNHPSILPCFAQSIPRFAQSLWATKDEWATEIKNLVAQINFSGHWPKTRSVQHCSGQVFHKFSNVNSAYVPQAYLQCQTCAYIRSIRPSAVAKICRTCAFCRTLATFRLFRLKLLKTALDSNILNTSRHHYSTL